MKHLRTVVLPSFLLLVTGGAAIAQAPVISAVTPVSNFVEQWSKFEAKLDITANWSNPYNYDEIRVECLFTDPEGATRTVEGFYMQPFQLDTLTGLLTPAGSGTFKVRYAPEKPGIWKYNLSCINASGTGTFPEMTFAVTVPAHPKNKGFVRSGQTNYLHLDNGEQYVPIGENICWQQSNVYLDYKNWLTQLAGNGGNYFRLWHCPWGLGIEWNNNNNGFQGLRRYKQTNAYYQDWLYDFCADNGIYVMLCLHYHGQVSTQVNPNWSESPYNAANGGPCQNTWDFFTQSAAKNHIKNRLRYIVARWGYARSILSWELFNEVDWTDQFAQKKADVSAWHLEMASFLKNKDPYRHLVSTSYAQDYNDPATWNQPDIDYSQTHHYVNTPNIERVLAGSLRNYVDSYGKPSFTGEFGLTTTGNDLGAIDPDGIHIHNSLWGTLFGGGMGAGATWWWDNYMEPQGLYYHFSPLSKTVQNVPFLSGDFSPTPAAVSGVPADLSLTPVLGGWGALADTAFNIGNGQVTPVGAALASFLYGSQWNTQFRRPPVFAVNYPSSGQFKVKTAAETGQAPKIAIWLDGVKVLEQNASVNQTYSIAVPAGPHVIRVDNTGTDWITIAQYIFTGVGSAADAYVLKSAGQNKIAGWVLNNNYNHDYIKANGQPSPAAGANLQVPGVLNGTYVVKYYNCMTGLLQASESVTVTNGALSLALPDVIWDVAFTVSDQPSDVAEPRRHIRFQAYPNPAMPGASMTLGFSYPENKPVAVRLLNMEGRSLRSWATGDTSSGVQHIELRLPEDIAAGFYWLQIETADGKAGIEGVVVTR